MLIKQYRGFVRYRDKHLLYLILIRDKIPVNSISIRTYYININIININDHILDAWIKIIYLRIIAGFVKNRNIIAHLNLNSSIKYLMYLRECIDIKSRTTILTRSIADRYLIFFIRKQYRNLAILLFFHELNKRACLYQEREVRVSLDLQSLYNTYLGIYGSDISQIIDNIYLKILIKGVGTGVLNHRLQFAQLLI